MSYSPPLKVLSSLLLAGTLSACGGGTNPTPAVPADPTLVGVAASGAPISNAAVTLVCGDGSTKSATTDSAGAYTITLTSCAAPYVVSVTGTVGDTEVTLVSVQATAAAAGTSMTMNVTPLTNAVAATLASTGDPADLVANFATEKAGITDAAVTARKSALVASLADTLAAAGLDATKFDIVSSSFSADRTGIDKVFDNVKVQVTKTGVSLTNVGGVKSDDMGDTTGTTVASDLSAGSISISRSTDFSKPLAKLPAAVDDNSIGDSIRDLLNTCFAQPKATRGSLATALSTACQAVPIAADYLNDGKTGPQEFDRYFGDAAYDNARFNAPEIIRFYSASATDVRALIKFTLTRGDGIVESFTSVGEQSSTTSTRKVLRGNQRLFKVFVNGFVSKRVQIESKNANNPKSTFYSTGINLYFGFREGSAGGSASGSTGVTGRKVAYAKVTGPGLPANGVFLRPTLAGCDSYYAIATSATAAPARCTSLFRMASRGATAADNDNFASLFGSAGRPEFASAQVNDANLVAIQPFSAYTFQIFNTSNALIATYIERLRSRPSTIGTAAALDGEIDKIHWNTLSAETVAAIDPLLGTAFVGGNPSVFAVKWTNLPNAARIFSTQVQTNPTGTALSQDQVFVSFLASSASLSNGTQGWPSMASTSATSAGAFNLVQLIARNKFDTQLFADWIY